MDMDMDIGWCLTCSKKTRDPSSPYCSNLCRQHDMEPESVPKEAHSITSPLPPKFIPLPPTPNALSRNGSGRVAIVGETRPDVAAVNPVGASSGRRSSRERPKAPMQLQRDRRAFSMSASEDGERVSLPFVRKAKPVNGNPRSFKKHLYVSTDAAVASMSTGANTPSFEPTFESNSDSDRSNDAPAHAQRSPVASLAALHPPPPMPSHRQTSADAVPAASQATSLSSPLQTGRPPFPRARATSPIARMGSSSRSREDIISWARQVDYGHSDENGTTRGGRPNLNRPRACRPGALSSIPPPSTEPLDEPAGSTPKGSVGAFGALHMTFTPVVDAIRRVSNAASPPKGAATTSSPNAATSSSLGLAPLPAPAEVSIVDVVVATRGPDSDHVLVEMDTPTLSTVSFSEAFDPSTTDIGETIESATDDFSIVSSIDRRPAFSPAAPRGTLPNAVPKGVPSNQQRRSSVPLRPIQSTASAIWTFSSYLRSLTPFAVPTSLVPAFTSSNGEPLATAAAPAPDPDTPVTPADFSRDTAPLPPMSMPHGQGSDTSLEDAAHDLVRSVPMDIVITGKAAAMCEERQREREALEMLKKGRSSLPRTPPAVNSRASSAGPDPCSGRPRSPDERERHSDGGGGRRGRGRGRGRSGRRSPAPEPQEEEEEVRRGRRRDRANESRDRSWSAARGRTRSRHPPHPVLVEGIAA